MVGKDEKRTKRFEVQLSAKHWIVCRIRKLFWLEEEEGERSWR